MRRDFWGLNDTFTSLKVKTYAVQQQSQCHRVIVFTFQYVMLIDSSLGVVCERRQAATSSPQVVPSPLCHYNLFGCLVGQLFTRVNLEASGLTSLGGPIMPHVMGLSEPAFALILAGFFALLITLFLLLLYIDGKRNAHKLREKERLLRAFRPGQQPRPTRRRPKTSRLR